MYPIQVETAPRDSGADVGSLKFRIDKDWAWMLGQQAFKDMGFFHTCQPHIETLETYR